MTYNILDTRENIPIDFGMFLSTLTDKDIIYIGEFHQVPEILSFQIDIISGLVLKGFKPSIGLEMFNVLQQKIIDYYIAGVIPFEQMQGLYEMGPEGFDVTHYISLIDIASRNRLKIIALNIPRNVASAVARHGLNRHELKAFSIDEEEIRGCSKKYRETIAGVYKKHPHEDITEENFILAQSIKDEMMAETIAYHMTAGALGLPLIVITGRGHIEYGLGIPERVKEKLSRSVSDTIIAVLYEDERPDEGMADYILRI
ncbi:MAG: ChaN family lipoprotein [Nitrospirae bacterium]|nr:ChaN family lipoprotein [Nitrospirota bacterium]